MTKQLESDIDLCPLYGKDECYILEENEIENFCAINYENCPKYLKHKESKSEGNEYL